MVYKNIKNTKEQRKKIPKWSRTIFFIWQFLFFFAVRNDVGSFVWGGLSRTDRRSVRCHRVHHYGHADASGHRHVQPHSKISFCPRLQRFMIECDRSGVNFSGFHLGLVQELLKQFWIIWKLQKQKLMHLFVTRVIREVAELFRKFLLLTTFTFFISSLHKYLADAFLTCF